MSPSSTPPPVPDAALSPAAVQQAFIYPPKPREKNLSAVAACTMRKTAASRKYTRATQRAGMGFLPNTRTTETYSSRASSG